MKKKTHLGSDTSSIHPLRASQSMREKVEGLYEPGEEVS